MTGKGSDATQLDDIGALMSVPGDWHVPRKAWTRPCQYPQEVLTKGLSSVAVWAMMAPMRRVKT